MLLCVFAGLLSIAFNRLLLALLLTLLLIGTSQTSAAGVVLCVFAGLLSIAFNLITRYIGHLVTPASFCVFEAAAQAYC